MPGMSTTSSLIVRVALMAAAAAVGGCRGKAAAPIKARPPGVVPALGAHVLLTHDQNRGVAPAVTAPIIDQRLP